MSVDVTIIGLDRLRAWLDTAPARFEAALWAAAEDSGEIQGDAIRGDTPELTGTLAGSITSVVEKSPAGVEVRTGTNVSYGPFVENGTRQHGEAHHMFQHGAQEATPEVEGVFRNAIRSITSTFGNV